MPNRPKTGNTIYDVDMRIAILISTPNATADDLHELKMLQVKSAELRSEDLRVLTELIVELKGQSHTENVVQDYLRLMHSL